MKIDFKTVKALASPTRVDILATVTHAEHTVTTLSDKLDKAKSTITAHIERLEQANLIKRDDKPERKRVTYHPTEKALTIVNGKQRSMTFTLTPTVLFATTTTWLAWPSQRTDTGTEALTADASGATQSSFETSTAVLIAICFVVAGITAWYAYTLSKLPGQTNS